MTCGHQATHANPSKCPYYNGERIVRIWDYSRQCIKCRTPRADHQPWKCPSRTVVRIKNRQYPPRIIVDYNTRSRNTSRSVSAVSTDTGFAQSYRPSEHHFSHSDDEYDLEHDEIEMVCNNLSAFLDEHSEPAAPVRHDDSVINSVRSESPCQDECGLQHPATSYANINTVTSGGVQESIRTAVDEYSGFART